MRNFANRGVLVETSSHTVFFAGFAFTAADVDGAAATGLAGGLAAPDVAEAARLVAGSVAPPFPDAPGLTGAAVPRIDLPPLAGLAAGFLTLGFLTAGFGEPWPALDEDLVLGADAFF